MVPTGAIEHHGPHLPLITDALIAESVATAAVERAAAAGLDVWQLPTLTYTKSDEHAWAPGTVWVAWQTLMSTLVDIGGRSRRPRRGTLVFLNGHGGNIALARRRAARDPPPARPADFLMPAGVRSPAPAAHEPDEHGLGIHAGYGETSLVLHLRPDLVDMTQARRNVPEHIGALTYLGFNSTPAQFGWLSNDFGADGVIGDPTGANAAAGAALFDASVDRAVDVLTEIAAFTHAPGA